MPTRSFSPGPATLFVAHPGHELCLHAWLERSRAEVFVLTDGSGGTGRSRLDSTTRVIKQCGGETGSIYGRFRDADVYRIVIDRDVQPFAALVHELAGALVRRGTSCFVADPWEMYNPTHDLCRVIADLAAIIAVRATAWRIDGFDYSLTAAERRISPAVTIPLDDGALCRKLETAGAYTEMREEVAAFIERYGVGALRREHLYCARPVAACVETAPAKPFYEVRGEQRVAAGAYATVLRYREHLAPFMTALAHAVGIPDAFTAASPGRLR